MINNAASAIIRQMIITLFERVSDEQEAKTNKSPEASHSTDALQILNDIFDRLQDAPIKADSLDLSKIDKPFALDLIESILSNHGGVFRSDAAFLQTLQDRLCPLIVNCFESGASMGSGKNGDFARICRTWRLCQLIVTDFADLLPENVKIFVAFWVRILRDRDSADWERAMVLEALKSIMSSAVLLESVYVICDLESREEIRLFKDLLEATLDLLVSIPREQALMEQPRNAVLSQFDKSTAPTVSPAYLLAVGLESFIIWNANLLGTVRGLTLRKKGSLECLSPISKIDAYRDRDMQMSVELLKFTGAHLSTLLIHLGSGESLGRLATLFGVFEMRPELNGLLEALISLAIPPVLLTDPFSSLTAAPGSIEFSVTNASLMQMILISGRELCELLNESWISIVKCQHALAQLLVLKERRLLNNQINFELLSASDSLLLATCELISPASFTFVIQAYCSLLQQGLPSGSAVSLQLLLQRLKLLLKRCLIEEEHDISWDCSVSVLLEASQSSEPSLRSFSAEISSSYAVSQASASLHLRVLKLMSLMAQRSQWPDVQKTLLDASFAFVRSHGESGSEAGWREIFSVCQAGLKMTRLLDSSTLSIGENDELIREAGGEVAAAVVLYKCVHEVIKCIAGDCLSSLPPTVIGPFAELIAELGRVALSGGEVNIPLNAVRYLWDVSDFIAGRKDAFDCWLGVLKHLAALGLDPRPELRNSAVATLLRTVNMNGCALKGPEVTSQWTRLFDQLLFPFLHDLKTKREDQSHDTPTNAYTHHSRNSPAKQWNETESTALAGLCQLIQSNRTVLEVSPDWLRIWKQSLDVFGGYVEEHIAGELVLMSVSSLLSLATLENQELWSKWEWICSEQMKNTSRIAFNQEALLKLAKIPMILRINLTDSLPLLTIILRYPTPGDCVRDSDGPSELQRYYITTLIDTLSEVLVQPAERSLLVEEIAKWCELAAIHAASKDTFTFSHFPSLRSRQSTSSSTASSTEEKSNNVSSGGDYTFIGLAAVLIPRSVTVIKSFLQSNLKIGCLANAFRAYSRYLRLKYKCPGKQQLWILAGDAFQSLFNAIDSGELKQELWKLVIQQELTAALSACKNQFCFQEGGNDDETNDCKWFSFLAEQVIPSLPGERPEIVALISEMAQLNYSEASEEVEEFCFPSGAAPVPVAVKEEFAFAAQNLLIQLASKWPSALESLTTATQMHLNNFISDRRVLGPRFPLSRLRIIELNGLLRGCLRVPGREHLRKLAGLAVQAEGEPRGIILSCRKILERLNGQEEEEDEVEDGEKMDVRVEEKQEKENVLGEVLYPTVPTISRSDSPLAYILASSESKDSTDDPTSPSKRSISDSLVQNFKSMELFTE